MNSSTDLKFEHDIARVKDNDPNLTSFLFNFQNNVGCSRLRSLANALRSNEHISQITFVNTNTNTTLQDRSSNYRLRIDHVSALEEALLIEHHCALQTVEVDMDFASPVAATEFGKLIRRSNGIEYLYVSASSGTDIDDSTVIIEALVKGLSTPPPEEDKFDLEGEGGLTKLKLSQFDLGRDAIDVLCSNIIHQEQSGIKCIDLSGNTFSVRGDLMGEALFGSKSCLKIIALGNNEAFWLDPSFFSRLACNNTLDTLLLVDMGYFSPHHAEALADALCHNTTLQELHIENNDMNEEELLALTPIFRHNISLERFSFVGNNIGDLEAISFAEAMCDKSAATNLKHFALNDNFIGDVGAKALAQMLRECKTMKSLSLTNNVIGDLGAMHIANAISQSSTIEEIRLDENSNIGIEGEEALIRSLHQNMSLQRFSMMNSKNDAYRILEVNDEIDKCLRMSKLARKLIKPDWTNPLSPALFCNKLAFLTTTDSDRDHEAKGQVDNVFTVLGARIDILVRHMPSS